MMTKTNKTGLKSALAFLMFFSAISPVYANAILPSFKSALGFKAQTQTAHTMPCHSAQKPAEAQREAKELCFQHCLQYFNEPCTLSSRDDRSIKKASPSKPKFLIIDEIQTAAPHFEVISLTDPPQNYIEVTPSKGLSPLLLTTARLRH